MEEKLLSENFVNLNAILEIISDQRFTSQDPFEFKNALSDFHHGKVFSYGLVPGEQLGYDVFRYAPDYCFYYQDIDEAKRFEPVDTEEFGRKRIITPYDPEAAECMSALRRSIDTWQSFIDTCIEGTPDLTALERMMDECLVGNLYKIELWPRKHKPYEPITWVTPELMSFEDHLESFGIQFYFFNGLGKVFQDVRKCQNPECEKYFLPKNPKGFFCSERCKGRVRYLKKINKI